MAKHHVPDFAAHPVVVAFHFKSVESRDRFMGQLSDGFGENFVNLDMEWWKHDDDPMKPTSGRNPNRVTAELFEDMEDEDE